MERRKAEASGGTGKGWRRGAEWSSAGDGSPEPEFTSQQGTPGPQRVESQSANGATSSESRAPSAEEGAVANHPGPARTKLTERNRLMVENKDSQPADAAAANPPEPDSEQLVEAEVTGLGPKEA